MKLLYLLPVLLFMTACSQVEMQKFKPNHFGIKPSYEIDTFKGNAPIQKYKVETSLDWNW